MLSFRAQVRFKSVHPGVGIEVKLEERAAVALDAKRFFDQGAIDRG
ncbi:MAG TPA: hypothetical protein VEB65_01030 [Solirubrobacterales bacterium]|nr:hypothetical protein [Solirubrobacterales bacterium]